MFEPINAKIWRLKFEGAHCAQWKACLFLLVNTLMETPTDAMSLASSEMPPGLSLTITLNVISLPSAARPLSRHLPSRVVSMLPPHRGRTTLNVVIVGALVRKKITQSKFKVQSSSLKSYSRVWSRRTGTWSDSILLQTLFRIVTKPCPTLFLTSFPSALAVVQQ